VDLLVQLAMAVLLHAGAVLALLGSFWAGVWCYPSGAPTSVCKSMLPGHTRNGQQITGQLQSSSPFTVTANTANFVQGQNITVTVSGSSSSSTPVQFMGLFLQARQVNTSTRVGKFTPVSSGLKTVACSNPNDAVTHFSRLSAASVEVQWTAPNRTVGEIEFVATVVYTHDLFWTQLKSGVLTGNDEESTCITFDTFQMKQCTYANFCG
jgi:hypothetical protein